MRDEQGSPPQNNECLILIRLLYIYLYNVFYLPLEIFWYLYGAFDAYCQDFSPNSQKSEILKKNVEDLLQLMIPEN